jgi:hypothetical protein
MVCQAEKDFIEVLLAKLCSMGKGEIPFDNDKFTGGFARASEYFGEAEIDEGLKSKLAPLFVKQTTYGEFLRAQSIIEAMNGRVVSLKNPRFVKATINMDDDYVSYLLDHEDLGLGNAFYEGIASAFCEGAKI